MLFCGSGLKCFLLLEVPLLTKNPLSYFEIQRLIKLNDIWNYFIPSGKTRKAPQRQNEEKKPLFHY